MYHSLSDRLKNFPLRKPETKVPLTLLEVSSSRTVNDRKHTRKTMENTQRKKDLSIKNVVPRRRTVGGENAEMSAKCLVGCPGAKALVLQADQP